MALRAVHNNSQLMYTWVKPSGSDNLKALFSFDDGCFARAKFPFADLKYLF